MNILYGEFLLIAGAEGNVESDFHAGTNYIQIKKHLLKTFAQSYPMIKEIYIIFIQTKKPILLKYKLTKHPYPSIFSTT